MLPLSLFLFFFALELPTNLWEIGKRKLFPAHASGAAIAGKLLVHFPIFNVANWRRQVLSFPSPAPTGWNWWINQSDGVSVSEAPPSRSRRLLSPLLEKDRKKEAKKKKKEEEKKGETQRETERRRKTGLREFILEGAHDVMASDFPRGASVWWLGPVWTILDPAVSNAGSLSCLLL